MNEILPAVIFSTLVVIALVLGYLIGYGHGRESENESGNTAQQLPAHQPGSADCKRGV